MYLDLGKYLTRINNKCTTMVYMSCITVWNEIIYSFGCNNGEFEEMKKVTRKYYQKLIKKKYSVSQL